MDPHYEGERLALSGGTSVIASVTIPDFWVGVVVGAVAVIAVLGVIAWTQRDK
jgi:hypothetical protein